MVPLVLHSLLVGLNTALSIMNFKNGELLPGTLWAITVPYVYEAILNCKIDIENDKNYVA